jgi:hypothetical protein
MFTDDKEHRDWIFGAVVTALVIGAIFWLQGQAREENTVEIQAPVEAVPLPEPATQLPPEVGTSESEPVYRRNSIAHVFECERNGQRVLSDQPCGSDSAIREIAAPNRMDAQDTRFLYTQPYSVPRGYAPAPPRSDRTAKPSICDWIEAEIDRINAQMRSAYRNGEGYREALRQLSKQRHEAKCIR